MPHVDELIFENSVKIEMIERIRHYRFEQIRKLEIKINNVHSDYIIEELCRLLPYTQHLIYKVPIQSERIIILFTDGFKYLLNTFFMPISSFSRNEQK
ncbi:unnamed protein product, partial [Rotaria sp. Silwood2]